MHFHVNHYRMAAAGLARYERQSSVTATRNPVVNLHSRYYSDRAAVKRLERGKREKVRCLKTPTSKKLLGVYMGVYKTQQLKTIYYFQ